MNENKLKNKLIRIEKKDKERKRGKESENEKEREKKKRKKENNEKKEKEIIKNKEINEIINKENNNNLIISSNSSPLLSLSLSSTTTTSSSSCTLLNLEKKTSQDDEALTTILLSMKSNHTINDENEIFTTTLFDQQDNNILNLNRDYIENNSNQDKDKDKIENNESDENISTDDDIDDDDDDNNDVVVGLNKLTEQPETLLIEPLSNMEEVFDEVEYNRQITTEYLRQSFHLPLCEVAQLWGISKPAFKKLCRQHGIKRWPSRQVKSIIQTISMLQGFCQENTLPDKILQEYEARLVALHANLESIMQNPNIESNSNEQFISPPISLSEEPVYSNKTEEISTDIAIIDDDSQIITQQLNIETASSNDVIDIINNEPNTTNQEIKQKNKRRKKPVTSTPKLNLYSPLDPHTGWVAECHKCKKLGKFRHSFEGRSFQHSTGDGKYCGYFRVNPRKIDNPLNLQSNLSSEIVIDESSQPLLLSSTTTQPLSQTSCLTTTISN